MKLADLASVCSKYAQITSDDAGYVDFLLATEGEPDLDLDQHRGALLVWLHNWGCLRFDRGYDSLVSDEIHEWWRSGMCQGLVDNS